MTWGGAKGGGAGDPKGRAKLGWKPVVFSRQRLDNRSRPFSSRPASRNAKGNHLVHLSEGSDRSGYGKDDPGIKAWLAFMDKYFPDGDKTNNNKRLWLMPRAQTMVQVPKAVRVTISRGRKRDEASREPEQLLQ